ncbi:hypothetical protein O181_125569, partial [Austropuccinia psidii MF-1]|nr:hypothetical protein [Austropuccinia psidii MF-1]
MQWNISLLEQELVKLRLESLWHLRWSQRYPEDKRPERPVLKYHKCGSTSNLANTCTKKTKINVVQ